MVEEQGGVLESDEISFIVEDVEVVIDEMVSKILPQLRRLRESGSWTEAAGALRLVARAISAAGVKLAGYVGTAERSARRERVLDDAF